MLWNLSGKFVDDDGRMARAQEILSRSLHELTHLGSFEKSINNASKWYQSATELQSENACRKNCWRSIENCISECSSSSSLKTIGADDQNYSNNLRSNRSGGADGDKRRDRNYRSKTESNRTTKSTPFILNLSVTSSSSDSSDQIFVQRYPKSFPIFKKRTEDARNADSYGADGHRTRFLKAKGPLAKKVERRGTQYRPNIAKHNNRITLSQAKSHAKLDAVEYETVKVPVRRALSVKDLNGVMVDFSNTDSVTKWTSQILAEIDSLPSSTFNVNELQSAKQSDLYRNYCSIEESHKVHRNPPLASKADMNANVHSFLSSPSRSSRQNFASSRSTQLTQKILPETTVFHQSSSLNDGFNDLSSTLKSCSIKSASNSSLESRTSSSITPIPTNEMWCFRGTDSESDQNLVEISPGDADFVPQSITRHSKEFDNAERNDKQQNFGTELKRCESSFGGRTEAHKAYSRLLTVKSARPSLTRLFKFLPKKLSKSYPQPHSLKNDRTKDSYNSVDRSQTKVPSHNEPSNSVSSTQRNVQTLITRNQDSTYKKWNTSAEEYLVTTTMIAPQPEFLDMWKQKANGRRQTYTMNSDMNTAIVNETNATASNKKQTSNEDNTATTQRRSVHGVVASLIRAAEETRFETLMNMNERFQSNIAKSNKDIIDIPASATTKAARTIYQDTATQTSPISSSRSSSFDWIHEPIETTITDTIQRFPNHENRQRHQLEGHSAADHMKPRNLNISDIHNQSQLMQKRSDDLADNLASKIRSTRRCTVDVETVNHGINGCTDQQSKKAVDCLRNLVVDSNEFTQIEKKSLNDVTSTKNSGCFDIDNSVAMLMEYAGNLTSNSEWATLTSKSSSIDQLPSTKRFNCSNGEMASSAAAAAAAYRYETLNLSLPPTFSSSTLSSASSSGNVIDRHIICSNDCANLLPKTCVSNSTYMKPTTMVPFSNSIYDNIDDRSIRKISLVDDRSTCNSSNESSSSSIRRSPLRKSDQSLSRYGHNQIQRTEVPQRDISISSGLLADIESTPNSPVNERLNHHGKPLSKYGRNAFSELLANRHPSLQKDTIASNLHSVNTNRERISTPPPSPGVTNYKKGNILQSLDLFSYNNSLSRRVGSCDHLEVKMIYPDKADEFSSKRHIIDKEAIECCRWLRDAGFPQYAKLYEESKFPINIDSVEYDHEFLDHESLKALYRRLHTLNRCAIMKAENVILRKQRENFNGCITGSDDEAPIRNNYNEDDDDDEIAISRKWRYMRNSHTWSRIVGNDDDLVYCNTTPETVTNCIQDSREQWLDERCKEVDEIYNRHQPPKTAISKYISNQDETVYDSRNDYCNSTSAQVQEPLKFGNECINLRQGLQRSHSERLKERARALMKRMNIRSSSRRRKNQDLTPMAKPHEIVIHEIGDPMLVSHFSASPQTIRACPNGPLPIKLHDTCKSSQNALDNQMLSTSNFVSTKYGLSSSDGSNQANTYAKGNDRRVGSKTRPARIVSNRNESLFPKQEICGSRRVDVHRSRDVSCDPSLMHAEFPIEKTYAMNMNINTTNNYQRLDRTTQIDQRLNKNQGNLIFSSVCRLSDQALNRCHEISYGTPVQASHKSVLRSGIHHTSFTANERSAHCRTHHRSDSQMLEPSISEHTTTIYNLADQRRLVVNRDGYYEHIGDFCHDSRNSLAHANFDLEIANNVIDCYGPTKSPDSSSSLTSGATTSRLKLDCETQKKVLASGILPSVIPPFEIQQSYSSIENCDIEEELKQPHRNNGERRDSGVGSSLSRSPSGPTNQRQISSILTSNVNASFMRDVRRKVLNLSIAASNGLRYDNTEVSVTDVDLRTSMDALSVCEMQRFRKMAFLKLSALIERYAGDRVCISSEVENPPSTSTNVKHWTVQKFIKRIRNADSRNMKCDDVSIFGLPLAIVQGRSGFVFPRCILESMKFLTAVAPETVGIFRKNGVRSRIAELKVMCDVGPEERVFVSKNELDISQIHDVADLLKQYLRDLPEPLMTVKYSEAFINIYLYLPHQFRITAIQFALLLLPDEHREALQTLLYFLNDIARHSSTNSMTAQNLAVCFSPSLFQLSSARLNNISPTRRHKTIGAAGMPTEKEMKESKAAQDCLSDMIKNCHILFRIPPVSGFESEDYNKNETDTPFLSQLGVLEGGNYKTYLVKKSKELLREHRDRWKGWIVEGSFDGVEISSKKSTDGYPLRYYRVWTDVEAPVKDLLNRIIRERNLWDANTINWRTVASLGNDNTCEVFQYVLNDTPPHPTRDFMIVRMWRSDLKELRGGCTLIERSVHSSETQFLGGIPAAVRISQFLIEPCVGRSRLTYVSRIDLRGRSALWYNKAYGCLVARKLARLRDSFKPLTRGNDGPETKV